MRLQLRYGVANALVVAEVAVHQHVLGHVDEHLLVDQIPLSGRALIFVKVVLVLDAYAGGARVDQCL